MNYVQFGSTGEQVSELCLGTMMFGDRCDQAEADRILGSAIDGGVTFIDTAAMYRDGETERILGQILPGRRDKLFIATKVHKGVDAASIAGSIDESLERMRIDYVDLYLIHWPRKGMQPEPIMRALNRVVQAGKARFVGCCNYPAWLFAHSNAIAERNGWARLVCNQLPYNLIERGVEVELLPQALAENVAITVYRPLLIGLLAGKYQPGAPIAANSRGQTDPRIAAWLERYGAAITRFNQLAAARGLHPAQLAIAWLRHSPAVTAPIGGVSALNQLQPLLDAFTVELSAAEHQELAGLFDSAVKEEAGGAFPGLRRELELLG
ncbi:MAG: aldo/keto reductase [Kouleothrix sp.]|jgi:aryl-alcohol dehydrogenase-like predicted oxidoreductase|nr:aldo/keto reductase [Kouleothrix sp.]